MRTASMLWAVMVFIHALLLFNSIQHEPSVAWDFDAHKPYMQVLSKGRLPEKRETRAFYSAPGPYVVPAVLLAKGTPFRLAMKLSQLFNVVLSALLFFFLVRCCRLVSPKNEFATTAAALLGMLPVYYHMLVQIRGELLVACISLMIAYYFVRCFTGEFSWKTVAYLGVLLGLVVLARQWGFFIFPPIVLFCLILLYRGDKSFFQLLSSGAVMAAISFVVGGWFYVRHIVKFGSAAAFNQEASKTALGKRLRKIFTHFDTDRLFSNPKVYSLGDHFFSTFHATVWSDYTTYFNNTLPKKGFDFKKAPASFLRYMGRVNLVSLGPTLVFFAGIVYGLYHTLLTLRRRRELSDEPLSTGDGLLLFSALVVGCSIVGYGMFVLSYETGGTHIKAGYMLHMYPFIAILAGKILSILSARAPWAHRSTLAMCLVVAVHNLPSMITSYVTGWPY